MSASPDDPDFLTKLMSGINNGLSSPMGLLAMSLMGASGPSRMPVSTGQALAQGYGGAQALQGQVQQNQMQRLMFARQLAIMKDMQNNPMGQPPTDPNAPQNPPQQGPIVPASPQADVSPSLASNPLQAPSDVSPSPPGTSDNPLLAAIKQASAGALTAPQNPLAGAPIQPTQAPTPKPSPQGQIDPYQDPIYLQYQKMARDMDALQPGSGTGYAQAAQQRMTYITTMRPGLWQNVDPKDYATYGLPAQKPGITWQRNQQTGEVKPSGESTLMDVTSIDGASGQQVHQVYDAASKKYITPAYSSASGIQPPTGPVATSPTGQPITAPPQYQQLARDVATYKIPFPSMMSRNPTLSANMAQWVHEINPDYSEGDFAARNEVLKSASGGADAKTLDAFNTIQSHLTTLQQAWAALKNGDVQTANKLLNWAGVKLGKDAPSSANIVNTLVSRELAKVLASGGVTTDADKNEANSTLNTYMSQNQQDQGIKYIQSLIGGKTNSVITRFKAAHLTDGDIQARFDPAAWQAYQDFTKTQGTGAAPTTGKTLTYDPATGTFH